MKADRRARRAGADGVLLTPDRLRLIRREDVWQAELVPFAAAFENDPEARPALVLVTVGAGPIWADIHRCPPGGAAEVAGILTRAVLAAGERVGRLPSRLEARYSEVVAQLADRLDGYDVEVSLERRLPVLDRMAVEFVRELEGRAPDEFGPSRACASSVEMWAGWMLPDATVAGLFEAAAAFYRAHPWDGLDDGAPLEIETPGGRRWVASVLGAGGMEWGLSVFSDERDRDRLLDPLDLPYDTGSFSGRCMGLTFVDADTLPAPMRREVMRAGWTVAGPEAYPHLVTINTPGGGVVEEDVRDLEAALHGLASAALVLQRAWAEGAPAEWKDPDTGTVVRLDASGIPLHTWTGDSARDPAAVGRIEALVAMLDEATLRQDIPRDLADEACELLVGYAEADPAAFVASRKPEIIVAACLHAAGLLLETPWSGWRPTLEQLAEDWDVSSASISKRSVEIREKVVRPVGLDRMAALVEAQMARNLEELKAEGADPDSLVEAAGFRVPPGPFDLDWLAGAADLGEPEARLLGRGLERALDRKRGRRSREPDMRPLAERLRASAYFGVALRGVLSDDEVPRRARHAVARWVLSRLGGARPLGDVVPNSSLLALSALVEAEMLHGEALASAVMMALALTLRPDEGLGPDDVSPLVRALGADPELRAFERAGLLRDLMELTEWGRKPREGTALIELMVEEAIPQGVRREALELISGWGGGGYDPRAVGPAARRRALVRLAELEDRPESMVRPFLEVEADDDVPALAAAEVLESHGSALPQVDVLHLVDRGLEHAHAPVRQAFFRAARVVLGDGVMDRVPQEVLERARREATRRTGASPSSTDPDQPSLF